MSVPATLSSTEDAIRVAEVFLDTDDLVVMIHGRAKTVLSFAGAIPPDAVLRIDELLLDNIGDDDDAVVLATRRRTGPAIILEDELARWRQLLGQHVGRRLALTDWLVFVRDDVVLSLAELAGPPPEWGR